MVNAGWDLIVVGAGSSGGPLAARSAEAGKRVLLLEAGQDHRADRLPEVWRSPNPVLARLDPSASEGLVWDGLASARTDAQAPMPYRRGRGLGGSSLINGQIAIRPPMQDFEEWAQAGITGWSPDDVLPYFIRLENDEQFGAEPEHGVSGPTPIYRTARNRWGAVDSALASSALGNGYPWAPDVNAPGATGVSPFPINSRLGRRISINDSYLEPARGSSRLTIRGDAQVDRILFNGNRAIGVSALVAGVVTTEYADTIVLSAGVIHSPAILMRSGIGPASELVSLGARVNVDLPVGHGLQDHPMAWVSLPLTDAAAPKSKHDRHTNVCVRTASRSGATQNDLMFVSDNQNGPGMGAIRVWLNQTYSRGHLKWTTLDPATQPHVRARMLSDPRDAERLREGIRTTVDLARSPQVADILDRPVESVNRELFSVLDNDTELDNYLLATVADPGHTTSTCRMGPSDDAQTVVDSRCRVLGVDGLHVVDASIFPSVPRANTHLAAIMAGELMADRL